MDDAVADVLKTIGWDTGFRLPIANEENQKLERELARLVIKKSALGKEYDDLSTRCKNMQDYLKYVRQEAQENQTLLTTYTQQLDSERHKLKLKQSEKDNAIAECRRLAKQTETIRARLDSKKLQLARNLAKLEKKKTEAEWDTQAMIAWEESVKKRDDDNELLKKFSDEDKKKVTELETKRNILQNELNLGKTLLGKMDVEVLNYEQVMKRTGKMLNAMKEEREALVNQWQESVKNLRQKDLDIRRTHLTIENIQETIKKKREEMEEQEAFLANEKNTNKYIELNINDVNTTHLRMRKELHNAIEENAHLVNAHTTKKKLMQRAAGDMNKVKSELKEAEQLKFSYLSKINKVKERMAELEEPNKIIKEQNASASKNADIIDKMIQEAEKAGQLLTRQMQTLLNKQYKLNSATAELTEVVNVNKAEVCALENALTQIRKASAAANQSLIHKKQLLSDLEMKVACFEAQMGSTEPDDMQEIQEIWKIKIQELEEIEQQHLEIKNLLQTQILKLQKENLRLVNAITNDAETHQTLKDKLQTLCLQIEGGIKQTKVATLHTQQLQVSENLLKLKVDKIQAALNETSEEIYNMQRYNVDLESTLRERLIEVNSAKDVLFAKKKTLDEDRSRLRADISQRNVRIKQLENKYNLALGMLGRDECGETMSVAAYKIKAAQEKYDLQQEGDELDKKIRKTEKEIIAMENTLKVVNMTNKSFKNSLTMVDEDSQDAIEMKNMEEQLTWKLAELKDKRYTLYLQIDEHKNIKSQLDDCLSSINMIQESVDNLEDTLAQHIKENDERDEKNKRLTRHLAYCMKNIDKSLIDKFDRELYIRQLQDINQEILYKLADFAAQYPEIYPILSIKFELQELSMPQQRTSLGSSVSSDSVNSLLTSVASSRSSGASVRNEKHVQKSERKCAANVTSLELTFDFGALGEQSAQSRTSLSSNSTSSTTSLRKDGDDFKKKHVKRK